MKNLKRLIYLKFARRLSRNSQSIPVPSIISNNSSVEGNIESSGIVHIDGNLVGNIHCDELVIGVKGCIKGEVKAQNLYIYGTLEGNADVDTIFIAKTAKLLGDSIHNVISIEPGAYLEGRCRRKGADIISMSGAHPKAKAK